MTQTTLLIVAVIVVVVFYMMRRGGSSVAQNLRLMSVMDEVVNAYRVGDYETALQKTEGLKKGRVKTPEYYFFRGAMLVELGRAVEAEANLREGLLLEKNPRSVALVWSRLGSTLLDQGRFEDALGCFENSLRIFPNRGGSHRGIAEVRLRQNREIEEALSQALRAVEIDRAETALDAKTRNANLAEDLAVLAWAVAATSADVSRVNDLINEALPLCSDETKPTLAKLHYHAGRAYSTLKMPEKSVYHFKQASGLDPQGSFGRLAREALAVAG
jgi:tetratricopeptide (TPR) repeat protein